MLNNVVECVILIKASAQVQNRSVYPSWGAGEHSCCVAADFSSLAAMQPTLTELSQAGSAALSI